jgi:hypothetical protein
LANKYFATLRYSRRSSAVGAGGRHGGQRRRSARAAYARRSVGPALCGAVLQRARSESRTTSSSPAASPTASTKKAGTHDLKGGGEYFWLAHRRRSQSATSYVFSPLRQAGGQPVYDASGVPIPVFTPGVSRVQNWLPVIGAVININTSSLYFRITGWRRRGVSLDLGTRFRSHCVTRDRRHRDGRHDGDRDARLGRHYDVRERQNLLQATYAHYAGKYRSTGWGEHHVSNPSRDVRLPVRRARAATSRRG